MAVTQAEVGAELREPAASPDPVSKDRIHKGTNKTAVDHERRELPTLGSPAGRDRGRRVHKHHLKKKQREGGRIITDSLEHKTFMSQQPERLAKQVDGPFAVQAAVTAHGPDRA